MRQATPPWANKREIRNIYQEASQKGLTVDHDIPLVHPEVCGLHVETNLQMMTFEDNARKSNSFNGYAGRTKRKNNGSAYG